MNCGPRGLPFDRNILYHNDGGVFRDVSDESGISKPDGNYSLGVLTGDFNGDGLTDIYVASDQTPSILYINQGNGKFVDEALLRGVALDDNGKALSGMGVAAADYLHEGIPSIFRTNFSDEMETLYRNRGKGEFQDVSVEAGMGRNTRFVGLGMRVFRFRQRWLAGFAAGEWPRVPGSRPPEDRHPLSGSGHPLPQRARQVCRHFGIGGAGHPGEAFLARVGVRGLRKRWLS